MLLFGILFFVRILHRNRVTDEYKNIINYLRKQMTTGSEELADYELPFVKHERYLRGGLADTLGLMNSILVAVLSALWLGSGLGWLVVVLSFILTFFLQVEIAKADRDKGKQEIAQMQQTFRVGVGAVISNGKGLVLAFERKRIPGSWQLPQGGVNPEESYHKAVIREIEEETGLKGEDLELLRPEPRFVAYEIPEDKRSYKTGLGQVQRWFLFRFTGSEDAITLGDGHEFRDWKWMTMDELVANVVPFKQEIYKQLEEYFSEDLGSKE
jgi:putative (di)nucleoside polyphosphate hydrolase